MNIGFVGLGAMGALIVPRLMAAGHHITGWNRSREKATPLIAAGMAFADTPRAVAAGSEIVFSIVTDSDAVKSLALRENGIISGLRKGAIYLDMSTIDPDASRSVGAAFWRCSGLLPIRNSIWAAKRRPRGWDVYSPSFHSGSVRIASMIAFRHMRLRPEIGPGRLARGMSASMKSG